VVSEYRRTPMRLHNPFVIRYRCSR
jgi:hypothetical protein